MLILGKVGLSKGYMSLARIATNWIVKENLIVLFYFGGIIFAKQNTGYQLLI